MDCFISDDEECRFYDAQEDVLSIADDKSDGGTDTPNVISNCSEYEVWVRSPESVQERRSKFMKWMGLSSDRSALENLADGGRIEDNSGAVTRISGFEGEFCSSRSSLSCWSTENLSEERGLVWDKKMGDDRDMGLDQLVVSEEPGDSTKASGEPPSFQHLMAKEFEDTNVFGCKVKRARGGWFRRLRSITRMIEGQVEGDKGRQEGTSRVSGCRIQRVKVRQFRKQMKELSALFMGQDFQAHEGSISAMKFSPDGQYLASAGEDGIVRLWKVVEAERCNESDTPELHPSCIYFTVNNLSELKPFHVDKEKMTKGRSLRKTSDSACIILPPKVFRLLERPLHEFHGHEGEVLDLCWSNNNHLLSSSVDKTVRLWRVGYDHCLKVFPHYNYVTCIQFNPLDDNYFISGSIDGKVRIWAISDCHVVDWTDVRETVTAVCYRPDGQGGIIGSMTGNCRFYSISENHLQLDSQLCLLNKKKLPGRGITGFQFLPHDFSKVMVTCADSQVRILDGPNVVGKYKGLSAGNHMSASLTSDGKHILSASEDSNVYLWNVSQEQSSPRKTKKIRSCERFFSDASIAVPWCGLKSQHPANEHQLDILDQRSSQTVCPNPPASFSLGQEFFSESPRGSATWPEEKLNSSSPNPGKSAMHKSDYKFLKASCQSTSSVHSWGLVIVTAGLDGRIKSFHNYGLPVII
ncbi:WD repeat-containing protein 44-like [Neltuma alba]|uniref:WD repeat-containing protein 44-like n=1 Tax=Neltuma alba TaxID=207710 RepID=UPI0010A37BC4|nr:WD repeat-containing protein 44-like [Prosopis alba]